MTSFLQPGDTAPWFHAPALGGNPRYAFDTAAGRNVVLLFLGSAGWGASSAALATVARHRALFDDARACLFGVSVDPADVSEQRIVPQVPGIRWFIDTDGAVSKRYGALSEAEGEPQRYRAHWVVLDPALRVVGAWSLEDGESAMAALQAMVAGGWEVPTAPVLVVPRVLDPELCRRLIALYDADGGAESGFMREENGITVMKVDHGHKRRSDYHLSDPALIATLRERLSRALRPAIRRAFQFDATRVERWLVACYDGDGAGGHFRAHRDNTTKGTAHRKFACTINLNADEYEGGDLSFPEFGPRRYRAPTGGAVVFSCSLLHEAHAVTRGRRYAFLPFLYDDAGARLREANLPYVAPELQGYRSGLAPEATAG